ncbi:MAG: ABC transporter ATP-binding protein, partial [Flavobacteriaceae bacterium]|nr:ABC transporter ATP-binding protein [Flavobacteriaceae bacterium]
FIKLVAQEFNVMPFTTVSENIAEHLSRINPEADLRRVNELLEVVDLVPFSEEKVKNLSGGQKQRVALAKALAKEPELLLLDEPFSNIDTFRKNKLRRNLFNYLKEKGIACITATHDAEEALAFSDILLVLKEGTVETFGTPENIYNNLNSEYLAGFFGEVNQFDDQFLLPHQLKISEEITNINVEVYHSYFRGDHYLIHAKDEHQSYFFKHNLSLKSGSKLYLTPFGK